MGGIVMTNDGNAILREIQVQHPAAKSMLEISRTQDEEVGDGTTSVVILAGEMLSVASQFIEDKVHPTIVIAAYRKALDDVLEILKDQISIPVDIDDDDEMVNILKSCLGTKFVNQWYVYWNLFVKTLLVSVIRIKSTSWSPRKAFR